MTRSLNNVPENNPRVVLSSPPDTNIPAYAVFPSDIHMSTLQNQQGIQLIQKVEQTLEALEYPMRK